MKPTFEVVTKSRRDNAAELRASRLPITDCNYHSVALDGFNGRCLKPVPSFRNISRQYFKDEARHSFAGEAIFFALIVITAAIPVINGLNAAIDLVSAFGAL